MGGVAVLDQVLGHGALRLRERGRLHRLEGQLLLGEVLRHVLQVVIMQVLQEIVHRRIAALSLAEALQLGEQVTLRPAGDAGEVVILGALPLRPVTGRAAQHLQRDDIRRPDVRWRLGLAGRERADGQQGQTRQHDPTPPFHGLPPAVADGAAAA